MYDIVVEYADEDKANEYFYNVTAIDVLANGFFRIVDTDNNKTYLIHGDTVIRIEIYKIED